jgi:hypothetical protein
MIQAGIGFATADMRFDAAEMHRRFPTIELTRIVDVVGQRFGRARARSTIEHTAASQLAGLARLRLATEHLSIAALTERSLQGES